MFEYVCCIIHKFSALFNCCVLLINESISIIGAICIMKRQYSICSRFKLTIYKVGLLREQRRDLLARGIHVTLPKQIGKSLSDGFRRDGNMKVE